MVYPANAEYDPVGKKVVLSIRDNAVVGILVPSTTPKVHRKNFSKPVPKSSEVKEENEVEFGLPVDSREE